MKTNDRRTLRRRLSLFFRVFAVSFLVIVLCGSMYAAAGSSGTSDYERIYATGTYSNWDGVTNVAQFAGPDGNLYYAINSDSSVAVHKTSNGTPVSGTVTLQKQHPLFGTVVCDSAGNYYMVTGETNSTDDTSVNTLFISKYDSSGKHIKTVGDNGSIGYGDHYNTKQPFNAGNCDAAIRDGVLTVFYARKMYSGHQSCTTYSVNTSDLSEVSLGKFYESHSFAQRVVATADGFVYMSEGDCYDRTFTARYVSFANGSLTQVRENELFDFWVREGALDDYNMYDINENFAHMGGIAALSNGYIAFAAQSAQSLNANAKTESEEIFLQIFDPTAVLNDASGFLTVGERSGVAGPNGTKEVTNYGVKWLTSYGDNYRISNVQIVETAQKEVVVLYELSGNSYMGVYYIVLDENGNVTIPATCFDSKARLNPCETPVVKGNKIFWVGNRSGDSEYRIYVYTMDMAEIPRPIIFETQPSNVTVVAGNVARLTTAVSGKGPFTYQWQYKAPNSSTWSNSGVDSAKESTVSITTTGNLDGYQYRCMVTDSDGQKKASGAATLTVKPVITSHPVDTTACVGDTAAFSVTVKGKTPITYQWQYRRDSSVAWADSGQSGAKTSKLSVATAAGLHGYQFRCVATDAAGRTLYSNTATLTLKPKITTWPKDTMATVGSTAQFTTEATGKGPLTYQWQYRKDASSEWKPSGQSGNKTPTLSVAATSGLHGYQFRCYVTDGNGQRSFTNTVTLTLKPGITTWPQSTSAEAGTKAEFTVEATGKGPLAYQWQYRKNSSGTWVASGQDGAKSATLSVTASSALHGYQFRCYVTDANGQTSFTNTVTLTVKPRITAQPTSTSVTVGTEAFFALRATGKETLTYQWQYRRNSSSAWANSGQSGNKTATLMVAAAAGLHGYQFRCIVTDGNGQKSVSKTVTLTIKPAITSQPANKSVTAGSTARFTVAATGKATLTYQWQYRRNATDTWKTSGQSGNKTATLSVSTSAGFNGYQFRCVITDANGQQVITDAATLTVK